MFSFIYISRGSSVSIVSDYGLDNRAIEVRSPAEVKRMFPLASVSRPALGPTQPPMQYAQGVLSPGVKRGRGHDADHSPHLVKRSSMSRSYISSPPCASMVYSGTALPLVLFITYFYINLLTDPCKNFCSIRLPLRATDLSPFLSTDRHSDPTMRTDVLVSCFNRLSLLVAEQVTRDPNTERNQSRPLVLSSILISFLFAMTNLTKYAFNSSFNHKFFPISLINIHLMWAYVGVPVEL
jgi:hypothetical protein